MKLVYLTSKKYPSTTADHFFIKSMSQAFTEVMGKRFLLLVFGVIPNEINKINVVSICSLKHFRTIFYFFWILYFTVIKKGFNKDTVCFGNDPNLLLILIFWKKTLGFKYKICSDWHMLHNNFKDKLIAENSDYLITTSDKLKKKILSLFTIESEKILTAYGGVDLKKYKNIDKREARDNLKLPQNKKIVSYVGLYKTMGMEKGISTMIDSLLYLSKDTVMMFVGGRDMEIEYYRKQANEIGVDDRCIFVEMVDFDRVILYEQASDVLAIPYPDKPHFRQYGFPMKVYEYMASKRPILYSKLELVEEVLFDCAFGFEADNKKDFAEQVEYILENKELSIKKSQKAYKKVLGFTWDARVRNIVTFLKGI